MGSCGSQIKHIPKEIPTYGYTFGLRIGSYILSSSLQLGSKQRISSEFDNQIYLIGVIDTGCICGVIRLPPGDYCNDWLGMGDAKILGGASIQMGLHGDNFLTHGVCLVLSPPLQMGGFRRSPAAHPRQNVVQYPPLPSKCGPASPHMMTSSNGDIFRVTGPLCGEFTGSRWIPHTEASDALLWCFLWSGPEQTAA